MSSITISEHVMHNGVPIEVAFDINHAGCIITTSGRPRYVNWNEMDDVELLASLFDSVLVKVFRVIVLQLGKIHANKDTYMGLIEE